MVLNKEFCFVLENTFDRPVVAVCNCVVEPVELIFGFNIVGIGVTEFLLAVVGRPEALKIFNEGLIFGVTAAAVIGFENGLNKNGEADTPFVVGAKFIGERVFELPTLIS